MLENKKQKTITPHEALLKAQKYCAYQERCQQEVREKLTEWRIKATEAENIIVLLINDDFLNEERFAKAYTRGKFRIKKWGKVKIKNALRHFQISDYCIKQGLKEINETEYLNTLKQLIFKNSSSIKKITPLQKNSLAKKLMLKGYEQDVIWNLINKLYK